MRAKYRKPRSRVHRDFVYLNHDSVINSLSAFEAGKVDEIIKRTTEDVERGAEASLGLPKTKARGAKRHQSTIQEELVLTRTRFSAFEAWYEHLRKKKAIGTFRDWNLDVRNQLSTGEVIEFAATIAMSPLHQIMTTYLSFVANPASPGLSTWTAQERKQAEQTAKMVEGWLTTGDGRKRLSVYFRPTDVADPRIMGRLDEIYVMRGMESVVGQYTVVAQVESMLREGEVDSLMRIIRDAPPTPLEQQTMVDAFSNFIGPSSNLGVTIAQDDLTFTYPTIVIQPIAVYR